MPGPLQRIHINDFRGGLALRRSEFLLSENESPAMLNVELDPRLGFYARKGMERVNNSDIADRGAFAPRHAAAVQMAAGVQQAYVTGNDRVWASATGTTWQDMGFAAGATPHLADFCAWGDYTYIVAGAGASTASQRMEGAYSPGVNDPDALTQAETGTWNDDYTTPDGIGSGAFPHAEVIETHKGYIFVANTEEDGVVYPNRIRWSHPLNPEDWATEDYLDLEGGGGEITALLSFGNMLLIFKDESVWALYGEDTFSFQFDQIDATHGTPHPGCVTRSNSEVYFYSPQEKGAIWKFDGSIDFSRGGIPFKELSEPLRPIFDEISAADEEDVWVAWGGRKLYVSVPWNDDVTAAETVPGYASFDGTGDEIVVADGDDLDIPGDFGIVAKVTLTDWTPASTNCIVSKWTSSTNVNYFFGVLASTGVLVMQTDTDLVYSSVATGVTDGQPQWVAVTVDVDDGAADSEIKFWLGGGGDTPAWSQLGTTQAAGSVLTPDQNAASVHIGSIPNTPYYYLNGTVERVAIYEGVGAHTLPGQGTKVFDVDSVDFAEANEAGVGDTDAFETYSGHTATSGGDTVYTGSLGDLCPRTMLVYDPEVGDGAWYRYEPAIGCIGPIVQNADSIADGEVWVVISDKAAAVCELDSQADAKDIIAEGDTGRFYDVEYRTGWRYANDPEQPKSWRRPRFVLPVPSQDTTISIDTYADYDPGDAVREHFLNVDAGDLTYWEAGGDGDGFGFDWGDGTTWGSAGASGSQIRRAQLNVAGRSGLGVWSAVQLKFSIDKEDSTGARWGVSNITMKARSRRATT